MVFRASWLFGSCFGVVVACSASGDSAQGGTAVGDSEGSIGISSGGSTDTGGAGSTGISSGGSTDTGGEVAEEPLPPCTSGEQIISGEFTDANLRDAVCAALALDPGCEFTCEQAKSLTTLEAEVLDIESLRGVSYLEQLTSLKLRANHITEIKWLEGLGALEELDLNSNCVEDENEPDGQRCIAKIQGLETLTSLTSLDVSRNQIAKIENLDALKDLKSLHLGRNQIAKIENLDELKDLKSLHLDSNHITKIEGLSQLDALYSLNLSYNHILVLDGLDELPQPQKLHHLMLSNNCVANPDESTTCLSKIENLEPFTQLRTLYLEFNHVAKIEGLDLLVELRQLHLGFNRIKTIEGLGTLGKLESLHLLYNLLTDGASKLVNLHSLTFLSLVDNQLKPIALKVISSMGWVSKGDLIVFGGNSFTCDNKTLQEAVAAIESKGAEVSLNQDCE